MRLTRSTAPLAALVAASFLTACVPIPYTTPGNPAVSGVLRRDDGTPASGRRVGAALRTESCRAPGLLAVTDSAGRFAFAPRTMRRRWLLVFPPIEVFAYAYQLCAVTDAADGATLVPAYMGMMPRHAVDQHDAVECVTWRWADAPRVTCSSQREGALATGGAWQAGAMRGRYQAIVATDTVTPRGWRRPQRQPRVFLLWIAQAHAASDSTLAGATHRVVRLPLERPYDTLEDLRIRQRFGGSWCLRVEAAWDGGFHGRQQSPLSFELGPPGEVRAVAEC